MRSTLASISLKSTYAYVCMYVLAINVEVKREFLVQQASGEIFECDFLIYELQLYYPVFVVFQRGLEDNCVQR